VPGTQLGHLPRRRPQEIFGRFAHRARQHQQELAAAARTQKDARQPELCQQRTRQDFAHQRDPLRPPGEQILTRGTRGASFGGSRRKKRFGAQDFALEQDLFGHEWCSKP